MLRVFTAFSGYDSQCLALDRLGIEYDLVGWSEIDKYAIQAHNALYPQYAERNYGDISKIEWNSVPDFDLFTYSSPCQDFSIAGLQQGGEKGSGTRSSLLWECERAISTKRPKYCIMENVAALVSSKFIKLFNCWQLTLECLGYYNYAKVLNAKDYGVPQNRERIFLISILDGGRYTFPKPQKLTKRIKDLLENNVDERFYLTNNAIMRLTNPNKERNQSCGFFVGDVSLTITAGYNKIRGQEQYVSNISLENTDKDGSAYVPKITKCLCVGKLDGDNYNEAARRVYSTDGVSPTLLANNNNRVAKIQLPNFRVRKLTPRECFRLMGVGETEIDTLLNSGLSNSRLYVLAGNSIVVDVLVALFDRMFVNTEPTELTLF